MFPRIAVRLPESTDEPCDRTLRRTLLFSGLIFVALLCSAQEKPNGPSVTVVEAPLVSVKAGSSSPVTLSFRVSNGFHVNSNKPNSELLIPTSVKLSPPTEIMIANIKYPDGQQLTFPFSPDEKLSVYSGDFKVSALVRAAQKDSGRNLSSAWRTQVPGM